MLQRYEKIEKWWTCVWSINSVGLSATKMRVIGSNWQFWTSEWMGNADKTSIIGN
jgi:hypothetical protein